jgi:N-acetylglucosamine kinase-like BadF-type ATPase
MILIADSGSTKTDWSLTDSGLSAERFTTKGINPLFTDTDAIRRDLGTELVPRLDATAVRAVYFYGAGCALPDRVRTVADALRALFANARIEVQSDLLGAARSLLGDTPGIAGILGTGSNACRYDGRRIADNVPPLGYILGDEGSGAHLGKLLVGAIFKRQLPPSLIKRFFAETGLTQGDVIERVYRQAYPNRFLASLAPFVARSLDCAEMRDIAAEAFRAYFERNILTLEGAHESLSLTGGIAAAFEPILHDTAATLHLRIDRITAAPMQGLIDYHLTH